MVVRGARCKPSACAAYTLYGDNSNSLPAFTVADFSLQKRQAFDKVATATNAGSIDGFAQLVKQNGTTSTLIQAGTNVYEWDLSTAFTLRGTVAAGTKMRGFREHNFTSSEIVLITDLAQNEVMKTWDGTTFASMTHGLGGSFYAKYCRVYRERAFLGNVKSGTATPHILLGSKIGDWTNLSTGNRPSAALGLDSAFFLPISDLRPINGLEQAFGQFIISTSLGRLHRLKGTNAFDFELEEFYAGSGVSGAEALTAIGNDVILGLPGRIDTLSGTINYGDVETDDATLLIKPLIENVDAWTIVYDKLTQRVFCFPDGKSAVYVLYKSLLGGQLSPWSKWTTGHALNFQPTTVWPMFDGNGLDAVYMGDSSGNIYKLNGTGSNDGGTTDFTVSRTSGLMRIPEGNVFDIEGWINYRRATATTVTLTFQFAGTTVFDQPITIALPANTGAAYYSGGVYYSAGS